MTRYYSTQRPIGPGTFPRQDGREIVVNFDCKTYCDEIGREAWGYVEYNQPLASEDIKAYELVCVEPESTTKKLVTHVDCPDCKLFQAATVRIDKDGNATWICEKCGAIHRDVGWYSIISHKKASEIIETRKPLGLFVVIGERRPVGIDNSSGDAWTEDFDDLRECVEWLAEAVYIVCDNAIDRAHGPVVETKHTESAVVFIHDDGFKEVLYKEDMTEQEIV